ncbi:M23 family metallopeptidase [Paraburkholderia phymatum]|uniref:Peptidase M23B n=1 Tax=Paraburkholderia phymatum (strain DSM 17167 / CIP 108236 / LMG 21445 / STM815) TaxID=391038 RepID=B2JND3_PARP8|nr:M23 family metallopeptidase [Paraburkholderia phymatum]ACC74435.1 peptidase M23B [Paraburkholderia phymatum STM815]
MTPTQSNRRVPGLPREGLAVLVLLTIGGCTTVPWQTAPEERSIQPAWQTLAPANRPAPRVSPNADKPFTNGYYRVKPGDTLYRIATRHGQRSDDIVKWNNLADPGHIEPGSVLRVAPPPDAADEQDVVATPASPSARTKTPAQHGAANTNGKGDKTDNVDQSRDDKADRSVDSQHSRFVWPARGTLSAVYGQGRSKGMVIAAKAGDLVRAAAPGRVVFAGDGGKPYGKLIVIKHDDTLVTAYGHNRKLLVKEGSNVKRGEAIAEMANTEHGEGSMQFEVRKQGKAVDPAPYLPRVGS